MGDQENVTGFLPAGYLEGIDVNDGTVPNLETIMPKPVNLDALKLHTTTGVAPIREVFKTRIARMPACLLVDAVELFFFLLFFQLAIYPLSNLLHPQWFNSEV